MIAGARGGLWDGFVERLVEIVCVFPAVLAVALVRALEHRPSILSLVIVMTAVKWAEVARLVRVLAQVACRGLGAGSQGNRGVTHAHRIRPHFTAPLGPDSGIRGVRGGIGGSHRNVAFLPRSGRPLDVCVVGRDARRGSWGAGARILLPPITASAPTLGGLYLIADAIRKTFEV